MSEQFAGVCVGGPYDGRQQVSSKQIFEVALMPEIEDIMNAGREDFEKMTYTVGRYLFDDGKWQWRV